MPDDANPSTTPDERFERVLAEVLLAEEAGKPLDLSRVVRAHPGLEAPLREFFRNRDGFDRLAPHLAPVAARPGAPDAPPPLAPGSRFGDYEVLGELGRGGMGVVYKARQRTLKRLVALKMILAGRLAGPEQVKRFRREARVVAQLDHTNIVPVYEVGEHDGQHYFSMKLIEGSSLSRDLAHYRRHHKAAAFLVARVARAVHCAHQRGVLHRDLKPGNVLLDARKQPHVTDFGLAQWQGESGSLSPEGAVIGTAGYMAPEQAAGRRRLTPAADVYGLGAILYEMLTGRPPFQGATVMETLWQVLDRAPVPPRQLNPAVPRDLETICLCCLDKRPSARYASAEALAEDLENWVEGRPIQVRRVGRVERAWLWCRRKPILASLSATAALLLVLVAVLIPINLIGAAQRAKAENEANEQKEKARQEQDKKRKQEYLRDMRAANLAWNVNDFAEVRRQLEKYRPVTNEETDFRSWEWYLFDAGTRGLLAALPVPAGRVTHLSWGPDGQRLAWGEGSSVRVRGAAPGNELRELNAWVSSSRPPPLWAPDGRRLATPGPIDKGLGGNVLVWDTTTGKTLYSLTDAPGWFAWSPDGRSLATSGSVGNKVLVRLWDSATGKEKAALPGTEEANKIWWSADSRRLATLAGAWLKVWDVDHDQRKELFTLAKPPGSAWDQAAWAPDGKRLAVLDNHQNPASGKITFVDAASGKVLGKSPEIENFKAWKWGPDGQRLAVVGAHFAGSGGPHFVRVLDATGQQLFKLRPEFQAVAWSTDGRRLLAQLPHAPEVLAWNATTGEMVAAQADDRGTLDRASFLPAAGNPYASNPLLKTTQHHSPNGRRLAEVLNEPPGYPPPPGPRPLLCVWDMTQGKRAVPYLRWPVTRQRPSFEDPDGTLLAVPQDGTVRDAWTGRIVHVLGGISRRVAGAAFSPDGRWLVTTHSGRLPAVRVWNATTGEEVVSLPGVTGVSWGPEGRSFAFVDGAAVKVWDPARGKEVQSLRRGGDGAAHLLAWSPDGKRLFERTVGQEDGERIDVWDLSSGNRLDSCVHRITHFGEYQVSWGPDSRRIFAEDAAGPLWTWELGAEQPTENGVKELQTWENRVKELQTLQTRLRSPDGRKWAAVKDQQLLVWDHARGWRPYPVKCQAGVYLSWAPDGRLLAVSNSKESSKDGKWELHILDTTADKKPVTIAWDHHLQPVAWDTRGERLLVLDNGSLRAFEGATGTEVFPLALSGTLLGGGWLRSTSWGPSGRHLVVALRTDQGLLAVCHDLTTGKQLFKEALGPPPTSPPQVDPAQWSLDGRFVLVQGLQAATCWDVVAGREVLRVDCTNSQLAPDGRRLLAIDANEGTVRLWDAASGKELFSISGPQWEGPEIALQNQPWSPDGSWLAASRGRGTTLWHAPSNREHPETEEVVPPLNQAAWAATGGRLAIQSPDGLIHVWGSDENKITLRRAGIKGQRIDPIAAASFHWSSDGRRLVVRRGTLVETWDVGAGKLLGECRAGYSPGGGPVASPDGQRIARIGSRSTEQKAPGMPPSPPRAPGGPGVLATWDEVAIWDLSSKQPRHVLDNPKEEPFAQLAWAPDGKHLATASYLGMIYVWDADTGKRTLALTVKKRGEREVNLYRVLRPEWSPDGKWLATALAIPYNMPRGPRARGPRAHLPHPPICPVLKVWNVVTGEEHLDLPRDVSCLIWSPDGKRLAFVSRGEVLVFDPATRKTLLTLGGDPAGPKPPTYYTAVWGPDSRELATINGQGTIQVWDIATRRPRLQLQGQGGAVTWSPDGRWLAQTAGLKSAPPGAPNALSRTVVTVWGAKTGQKITLPGHLTGDPVWSGWRADGRLLAVLGSDGTMRVWDVTTPDKSVILGVSRSGLDTITAQAWAPDSTCLATGNRRGEIRLRTTETGGAVPMIQGHAGAIRSLLWSRDGRRLASCAEDGTVKVWDRATGKELMKVDCVTRPNPPRMNLAWAQGGDRLAVAEDDGTIKIWDIVSQQVVHTLHGHNGPADLAWGPRIERLASGSQGKEGIKIWDTDTGQEIISFPNHGGPVAWSADGWRLECSGENSVPGSVTVWDATRKELPEGWFGWLWEKLVGGSES
jgi:WD40 repeat protein/predicted Ser/Thr protein kinase